MTKTKKCFYFLHTQHIWHYAECFSFPTHFLFLLVCTSHMNWCVRYLTFYFRFCNSDLISLSSPPPTQQEENLEYFDLTPTLPKFHNALCDFGHGRFLSFYLSYSYIWIIFIRIRRELYGAPQRIAQDSFNTNLKIQLLTRLSVFHLLAFHHYNISGTRNSLFPKCLKSCLLAGTRHREGPSAPSQCLFLSHL